MSFAAAVPVLYALRTVPPSLLGFAAIDGMWAVLFVLSYLWTPRDVSFKK